MTTLTNSSPFILALVAVLTVLVNLGGLWLQSRRDQTDYTAKLAKVASDLFPPYERRIAELERRDVEREALVKSLTEQIESQAQTIEDLRCELRATKADRNQLLAERLIWQRKMETALQSRDECKSSIRALDEQVARLTVELARLQAERDQGAQDVDLSA